MNRLGRQPAQTQAHPTLNPAQVLTTLAASLLLIHPAYAVGNPPDAATPNAARPALTRLTASPTSHTPSHAPAQGLMLGVGLSLALIGAAVVFTQARRPRPDGRRAGLHIVGRIALGPGQAATLLQAGDRLLLVGTARGAAPRLLAELDPNPQPAPAPWTRHDAGGDRP
ncbi:MAG: hypothetical protein KatS3mg108_0348 [Isosphaeraceae bacterium]|nr:MAG: hypothetical protein KatS3mg108_0348 [Isosphaeraceae bacterium]